MVRARRTPVKSTTCPTAIWYGDSCVPSSWTHSHGPPSGATQKPSSAGTATTGTAVAVRRRPTSTVRAGRGARAWPSTASDPMGLVDGEAAGVVLGAGGAVVAGGATRRWLT